MSMPAPLREEPEDAPGPEEGSSEQPMATESEIAKQMGDYLRANGYICGRKFASVGGVAKSLAGGAIPNETEATLAPKIRSIIASPTYGFKTSGHDDVSASEPSKCGN